MRLSRTTYAVKMSDGQWALVIKSKLQKGRWPDENAAVKAYERGEF